MKAKIPNTTLESWQRVVDLMAKVTSTPAGLIMSLESRKTLNVLVASKSRGNAWQPGDACPFESGVYCEDVI